VIALFLFLLVFGVPVVCWLAVRAARSRRPLPES